MLDIGLCIAAVGILIAPVDKTGHIAVPVFFVGIILAVTAGVRRVK